jgi:hypothetical protein
MTGIMAADLAALRTALGRMGLTVEAAEYLIDHQGMDSLSEFQILTDDEVETLYKVIRRPAIYKVKYIINLF